MAGVERLRTRVTRIPTVWRIVAAMVVTAAVSVGLSVIILTRGPAPLTQADVDAAVRSGISAAAQSAAQQQPAAAVAYAAIADSLVSVRTSTGLVGAGVIANADGSVLTAWAVVQTGTITLTFSDGSTAKATVASHDVATDTALLTPATPPQLIVPATLGGSVAVGSPVFAVGDPAKLVGSLTAGVVSGTDRNVKISASLTMKGLIQFDAAVNPGTAGGPLVDTAGRVVGVITRVPDPTGQTYDTGIGFAVPIGSAGGGGRPRPPQ